jgi:predicted acetyltransferase
MPRHPGLVLTRLAPDHRDAYLAMVDEFEAAGEGYPFNNVPLARSDFGAYVRELHDEEHGIGLPPGIVPQTTYVLVRAGTTIVGEIRFRPHTAPPFGAGHDHIGYNVRPSERRRGYATLMLSAVLDEARALGLDGVSLAVGGDNPGSVRTIIKHGGILAARQVDPLDGTAASTYWIAL